MLTLFKPRYQRPTPDTLARYAPFQGLALDDLILLSKKSLLFSAKRGQVLFKAGSIDDWAYFLVSGELQLKDQAGNSVSIKAEGEQAKGAISALQPRRYTAMARTHINYIKLDKTLLYSIQPTQVDNPLGNNTVLKATYDSNLLFRHIYDDLARDRLVFPSFDEISKKIRRLMESEDQNMEHILRVIQVDPVLSARLIKAANGPLFYGKEAVDNCSKALLRIGLIPAKSLCVSYLLQTGFTASLKHPALQRLATQVWQHSVDVAAIAFVLAHIIKGFEPEQAMLAGLVHDIGALAVLHYAERESKLCNNPKILNDIMLQLQGEVGALLLQKWRFPESFIDVAREAERWQRQPDKADYCDVVMVAQLHSFVGNNNRPDAPKLSEIPTLKRLGLGGLTPQHSLRVLDEARQQIQKARQLLG